MAQYQIKLASTAYPLVFLMVDSADHVTGKTGLTPTVTISKAGATFGSPSGAVSEIANGWYKVAGNATDSGTLGALVLHATGTGADPTDVCYEVVAFDPQDAVKLGLTRVVANVDQIEGTDATDALDARITAAGLATATALATAQTSLNTIAGYIDTEVAAILAAVDTEVAAIKAKTDNLPSDPADQSQVEAAITAATTGLATAAKLLKYVQLLARKDAAIATDNATELTAINASGGSGAGSYVNTTDSQEAIRDRGDAAWTTGAGADPTTIRDTVWGTTDGTRTVTQTGAQVADAIDGEDLTVHRGDTFSATLTGITIPTDWTKLVFTAKRGLSDADTASVVQIVLTNPSAGTDGLKYLEGAAPVSPVVAADAALTVPGLTSLTITMKPRATKELGIGSGWFYDVQADYGGAGNSTTVCAGAFAVDADVTRSTP